MTDLQTKFSSKKLLALFGAVLIAAIGIGGYAYYTYGADSETSAPPALEMDLTSLGQGKLDTLGGFADLPASYGYACHGSDISLKLNVNHLFATKDVSMKDVANSLKFNKESDGQYLVAFFSPGKEEAVTQPAAFTGDVNTYYLYPTARAPFKIADDNPSYTLDSITAAEGDDLKIPAYRGFQVIVNNEDTKMCGTNFKTSTDKANVWADMSKADFTGKVSHWPKGWVMMPSMYDVKTSNALNGVIGTASDRFFVQTQDNLTELETDSNKLSAKYVMRWVYFKNAVDLDAAAWDVFDGIMNPRAPENVCTYQGVTYVNGAQVDGYGADNETCSCTNGVITNCAKVCASYKYGCADLTMESTVQTSSSLTFKISGIDALTGGDKYVVKCHTDGVSGVISSDPSSSSTLDVLRLLADTSYTCYGGIDFESAVSYQYLTPAITVKTQAETSVADISATATYTVGTTVNRVVVTFSDTVVATKANSTCADLFTLRTADVVNCFFEEDGLKVKGKIFTITVSNDLNGPYTLNLIGLAGEAGGKVPASLTFTASHTDEVVTALTIKTITVSPEVTLTFSEAVKGVTSVVHEVVLQKKSDNSRVMGNLVLDDQNTSLAYVSLTGSTWIGGETYTIKEVNGIVSEVGDKLVDVTGSKFVDIVIPANYAPAVGIGNFDYAPLTKVITVGFSADVRAGHGFELGSVANVPNVFKVVGLKGEDVGVTATTSTVLAAPTFNTVGITLDKPLASGNYIFQAEHLFAASDVYERYPLTLTREFTVDLSKVVKPVLPIGYSTDLKSFDINFDGPIASTIIKDFIQVWNDAKTMQLAIDSISIAPKTQDVLTVVMVNPLNSYSTYKVIFLSGFKSASGGAVIPTEITMTTPVVVTSVVKTVNSGPFTDMTAYTNESVVRVVFDNSIDVNSLDKYYGITKSGATSTFLNLFKLRFGSVWLNPVDAQILDSSNALQLIFTDTQFKNNNFLGNYPSATLEVDSLQADDILGKSYTVTGGRYDVSIKVSVVPVTVTFSEKRDENSYVLTFDGPIAAGVTKRDLEISKDGVSVSIASVTVEDLVKLVITDDSRLFSGASNFTIRFLSSFESATGGVVKPSTYDFVTQ